MSKTMAEVLAEHAFHLITPVKLDDVNGPWQVECNCTAGPIQGPSYLDAEAAFAAHQAAALSAAGFGLVADAKAEALSEAAERFKQRSDTYHNTMQEMTASKEYGLEDIVRYGAYSAEANTTATWLRTQAAKTRSTP